MTVTVLIGNTDNKLTQSEWHDFVATMQSRLTPLLKRSHFFGGPATHEALQNVCWVLEVEADRLNEFRTAIADVRKAYGQDSAAMTCGETEFI